MALQDVLRLYLFALVMQLLIHLPYVIVARSHHQTAEPVLHRLASIVVYAAPPGVPTVMAMSGLIARGRLAKDGVTLMFPECLRQGADLDLVALDKTGTLTHRNVSALAAELPCPCLLSSQDLGHAVLHCLLSSVGHLLRLLGNVQAQQPQTRGHCTRCCTWVQDLALYLALAHLQLLQIKAVWDDQCATALLLPLSLFGEEKKEHYLNAGRSAQGAASQ